MRGWSKDNYVFQSKKNIVDIVVCPFSFSNVSIELTHLSFKYMSLAF